MDNNYVNPYGHTQEGFIPHEFPEDPWFTEWVEFGLREFDRYLVKWSKFSQYLVNRKLA